VQGGRNVTKRAGALLLWLGIFLPVLARARPPDHAAFTTEEVTYAGGDAELAASVLLPPGPGPFPGVVIVHGSGSSDRSNPWTAAYARALVERGIAVLHPDKRGSGKSGGSWRDATFETLADDAAAGLEQLCSHSSIDTSRVGLIGFSQGGDIVPLAATHSTKVRFVIDVSGSVVPMAEQIGDEVKKMGEREGLSQAQLEALASLNEMAIGWALTGEGWDAYAGALSEAKEGALSGANVVAGFPTEPDSPAWGFLRTVGNFDPLPYWRELRVPALFLYGGKDQNVDVYKSADLIEGSLTEAGVAYSLLLFRNNGHALFRDDAMDFIARWIRDGGAD